MEKIPTGTEDSKVPGISEKTISVDSSNTTSEVPIVSSTTIEGKTVMNLGTMPKEPVPAFVVPLQNIPGLTPQAARPEFDVKEKCLIKLFVGACTKSPLDDVNMMWERYSALFFRSSEALEAYQKRMVGTL